MSKDDDTLKEAREEYTESEDAWGDAKNGALDDLRFGRLGEQWSQQDINARKAAGRPCLTINDLPASVRQVVNDGRQNRPAIKIRPVDSQADVKTAEIISGLIKHIETISDADVAYDTALDCAASMRFGFMGVDVEFGNNSFDRELKIRAFPNPLCVSWDAKTQAVDSSDWRYAFITEKMDKKEFERQYPGLKYTAQDFADDGHISSWYEEESVRIAQWYKREETTRTILMLSDGTVIAEEDYEKPELKAAYDLIGVTVQQEREAKSCEIIHRLITGKDILDEKRWRGSIIPIVPVYGEMINAEGKWYFKSVITDAKDAQRMFNLSRSTVTELIGRSPKVPWLGKVGQFETDADKWDNVNTDGWPYIEYDGELPPQRVMPPDVPNALIQEAMSAADDKKRIIGIHDASLGLPGREVSGKAIRYRQHESDVSTFNYTDNQHRGIRGIGRVLLEMIPQIYTPGRIIRIIGDDGKSQNIPLGKPVQQKDGTVHVYDLGLGTYDLTVEAGPSYTTRRAESAEMLGEFMRASPGSAPILGPAMVKISDLPDGDKYSQMLATMMPPAARAIYDGTPPPPPPGPPPEVAAAQAKAQADMAINQQKAQQDFQLEQQKAQNRAQIEQQQAQADIAVMQMKAQAEIEIERQKAGVQLELKRQEADLAAQLKLVGVAQAAQTTVAPGVQ